ncbi:YbaK/EbsC family protein [Kineococcus rhizosphaerae]|uniref:Prolyl-tRNA editing enzyme YbaK/EbsC (Cys-tRNA(Pro) deacylase) n=1 Tax=Kineococcus rhizosphaerae TaxID=559628 RepID=A0A2T0RAT0_9ACTN|nr:YbaK/EbsC family protein [Kineococcus rhizosphaerae]PRY18259.1 prolyl-tRNA editing enzyme YbaK/EbsC (Cys-tRNA(Pro) deacylase) [Kineococcus rhizosphaerae]
MSEAQHAAGTLTLLPAAEHPELLPETVRSALPEGAWVTAIDPDLADTAALVEAAGVPREASANCVVVAGRRDGQERVAACVVLASTRADVNGAVKRTLEVRKASFLPMERAVAESGMEHGGITPLGLPADWRVLVDRRVVETDWLLIGSGVRRSKLVVRGADLAGLPNAEVVDVSMPAQ